MGASEDLAFLRYFFAKKRQIFLKAGGPGLLCTPVSHEDLGSQWSDHAAQLGLFRF